MALNIGDNFSYLGAKPLDNREVYTTKADLLAVNLSTVYEGMVAYVKGEDKYYRLKGITWVEFSSGSGAGISNWASNTVYAVDDVVINNSNLYICTTAHTSGSSFDATEEANWNLVGGSSGTSIEDWATSTAYTIGDIVIYANSLYRCNTSHTSTTFSTDVVNWDLVFADLKDWTNGTYYYEGTTVINGGKIYKCITDHTSGATFDSSEESNWQLLGGNSGAGITLWATSTDYELGDIVIYADSLYKCNTAHTSSTFSADISNWDLVFADLKTWQANTYYYIRTVVINGNNIYKCVINHTSGMSFDATEESKWQMLGERGITTWVTSKEYEVNNIVLYAGSIYKCVSAHISTTFNSDSSKWNLIYADIKPWVSGDYYTAGTCVIDSNRYIWKCKTAHTAGLSFDTTEEANWEMIGGDPDALTPAQVAFLVGNFNPAGDGLMQLDNWEANHGYTVKQVVYYNGSMYRCKTAHTSGSTFDSVEEANWDEIVGGSGASITDWASGTSYAVGDFVIYNSILYKCITANADASFTPSKWQEIGGGTSIVDWATSTSYSVGDFVRNNNVLYVCNTAHTSTTFSADKAKWDSIKVEDMVGATSSANGKSGGVPAPTTTDIGKYLRGDGTWGVPVSGALNIISEELWTNTSGTPIAIGDTLSFTHNINDYDYVLLIKGTGGTGTALFPPDFFDGNRSLVMSSTYGSSNYDVSLLKSSSGMSCSVAYLSGTGSLNKIVGWKFVNPLDYSTTEKRVGTWIDGSPLYQCTFSGTTPTSTSGQQLFKNVSSYGIVKCISIEGNIQRVDGTSFPLNAAISTDRIMSVYMQNANTDIYMNFVGNSVSDLLSQQAYVTLTYTKV